MLTIGERIRDDGSRETVSLDARDGEVWLRVGDASPARLPEGSLDRVMARYGKPVAEDVSLDGPWPDGSRLEVGAASVLYLVRHLARYDVIARDFLVWTAPGKEPVAELAVSVTAALVHLSRLGREAT